MSKSTITKDEWIADLNAARRSLTNEKAWDELYRKAYPKVRNFVRSMIKSEFKHR